jgi:hypothetical protein
MSYWFLAHSAYARQRRGAHQSTGTPSWAAVLLCVAKKEIRGGKAN